MGKKHSKKSGEWGKKTQRSSKDELRNGVGAVLCIGAVAFFMKVDNAVPMLKSYAVQAAWVLAAVLGALLGAWLLLVILRGGRRTPHEDDEDDEDTDEPEPAQDGIETAEPPSLLDGDSLVPFLLKVMSNRRGCHLDEVVKELEEAEETGWTKKTVKEHLTASGIDVDDQTNLGQPWGNKVGVKRKNLPGQAGPGDPSQMGRNIGPGLSIVDTHNGGRVLHHR